jgi:hypothetical protein
VLLNTDSRVQFQSSACGICDGQAELRQVSLPVILFRTPPFCILTIKSEAGVARPFKVAVPKDLILRYFLRVELW